MGSTCSRIFCFKKKCGNAFSKKCAKHCKSVDHGHCVKFGCSNPPAHAYFSVSKFCEFHLCLIQSDYSSGF